MNNALDKIEFSKRDFCYVNCEYPFFLWSSVVRSNYGMVAKAFEVGWKWDGFKTNVLFMLNGVLPRFTALTKENVSFAGLKNIEQISNYMKYKILMK